MLTATQAALSHTLGEWTDPSMQAITFPMYRSFRGWSGCMPPARGDSADTVYQRSAWAARSPDFGEGRRGRSGRESAPIDIATCSHGLVQSAQGAPIAAAGRLEADGLDIPAGKPPDQVGEAGVVVGDGEARRGCECLIEDGQDRKSTRLNSSH